MAKGEMYELKSGPDKGTAIELRNKEDFTKEEKVSLVRDVMVRFPDYKRFGYHKKVIEIIIERAHIRFDDYDITRYIQEVEGQWKKNKTVTVSKGKINHMLMGLFEDKQASVTDKRMVLQDIAKINGEYQSDITINNILPEDEERLKKIFGNRKETGDKKKEKVANE